MTPDRATLLPTPTPTPTPTTAQAHPTAAGTPALLVSRVVLAVLVPAVGGKATIPPPSLNPNPNRGPNPDPDPDPTLTRTRPLTRTLC